MTYSFRWVEPGTAFNAGTHAGMDEDIFEYYLDQTEGNFATLALVIANPGQGLLYDKRWAWFSEDGVPRFFGRVVGVPEALQGEGLTITLVARPDDFVEQQEDLAETLKEDPEFWEPVFVDPASLNDPNALLLARAQSWHVDPVSHVVTVSSNTAGEDGLLTFGVDEVYYDPVGMTYNEPPAKRFEMEATIRWTQRAAGTIDVAPRLIAAFAAAGTTQPFMISSYTADGLVSEWPLPGDDIGAGWKVADSNVENGGGRWVSSALAIENRYTAWAPAFYGASIDATVSVAIDIGLGVMKPTFVAGYDVRRSYTEKVTFTLEADVQNTVTDPGDAEVIRLSLSSNDVSEPVDPNSSAGEDSPIIDVRRRSYMLTDRGYDSAKYLVNRARAALLDRSRCVNIPFEAVFSRRFEVSTRKSATLTDPRLPGGAAQGKITSFREAGNGDSGDFTLGIVLAVCVGNGGSVSAAHGTGTYVDDGYVDDGYQTRTGQTLLAAEDVTLTDYGSIVPNDDGIEFLSFGPTDAIELITVTNGPNVQRAALKTHYKDVAEATEDLQAIATRICLDMTVLTNGPFETDFPLTVSGLKVPQGINLAAS